MTPTARETFERWQRSVLDHAPGDMAYDHLHDDVVVEWPFSPPGRPRRIEGRAAFEAFARPARAALPVRFEEFRDVVVHQTADPEVIVAEYTLAGTVLPAGRRAAAAFVTVLRVRDGKVIHIREYQDVVTMAAALGDAPAVPDGR
ncbi:hypothetical protein GCM10009530_21350 [Microbispora corallina]|uniref:SnoaL-like domain-containing protein n=1 Tax=Microbispora corallina TaxID=83302 RepID=A0ABQ4G5W9_9ACTN|nr:nuclear transport factor 2 family protein [Microbispora corallina]GIH42477.1 hypothetical protein Mco01_54770 [Microbispora corallina]